ncbi:hypothetical protein F4820DRAFT_442610 [Hypoxylon rubiginosum]|uniref:Uncharacterized protein n=1 Tax=Hypoxylon rubiginosum TaxID=110542 RepID=A0ACB9ZIS0_9PEZI|nr:hypothetical protein F4820DRAFT_442610 [Hypoxylon rubiginosum]
MQPICVSDVAMRVAVQGCRRGGNSLRWAGAERSCRRYATSSSKRARPPPPPKQPPATPKPLPFQPAKSAKPKPSAPSTPKSRSNQDASPHSSPSSSSRDGDGDGKRPMSELVRNRWFPLFGAGAAAMCVGLFTVSLLTYWRSHPAEHWTPGQEPVTPTGRPSIQSPREFDQHLDKSEWRYGITKLRRRIASEMVRGHVLEVAVGTGRNFDYYDWSVVTEGLEPVKKEEKSSWFGWLRNDEKEKEKEKEEKGVNGAKGEKKNEKGEENKPPSPPPSSPPPQVKAKAQNKKPNPNAVLSFTGLDISPIMLDLALTRIRQVVPHMEDKIPKKPSFSKLASATATGGDETVTLANNRMRLLKADAQLPLPPPPSDPSSPSPSPSPSQPPQPPPQKYDTIIQTFGLCSVRDPVLLLSHMAARVQPDTGRIVLLEHGRGWWGLVNGLLDRGARGHFERFGCWWNRDVELVVRAAERAVPGLEVLRLERPGWVTLGTHVLVEMRVNRVAAPLSPPADEKKEKETPQAQKSATSWWPSFLSASEKPKKDE